MVLAVSSVRVRVCFGKSEGEAKWVLEAQD